MKIFGFDITRTTAPKEEEKRYLPSIGNGGWYPYQVHEPFTGAWQKGITQPRETYDAHFAVYACVRLISSDVGKCRIKLVQKDQDGIWSEVANQNPFSPVLAKPNRYQSRIEFLESWVISLLRHGNTYVLKDRDARGIVTDMYVLDPCRTKPLVADDGSVFYQLAKDNLSGVEEENVTIPASEIIHDKYKPLYHPLCGVSPLYACGLAALNGLEITNASTTFFANQSLPGGILTAPGNIPNDSAQRVKMTWENHFMGAGRGRIAILGDGMTFHPITTTAVDSQLIEQLKWSAEAVCSAFGVPMHKIGVGQMPNYNNIEALERSYYAGCLQVLIEKIEVLLDEGLGLTNVVGRTYGCELDLDEGLFRTDNETMSKFVGAAVGGGWMAPNEARAKFDLKPVEGGETPYLQNQNWSLAALARRGTPPDTESQVAADPPPQDEGQRQALLTHYAGVKAREMLAG